MDEKGAIRGVLIRESIKKGFQRKKILHIASTTTADKCQKGINIDFLFKNKTATAISDPGGKKAIEMVSPPPSVMPQTKAVGEGGSYSVMDYSK